MISKISHHKPSNIALIGYGYWGPILGSKIEKVENTNIHSIIVKSEQTMERAKKDFPSVSVTTDFAQAFENPEINAVIIATPFETHYELAKKALEAGKHVLIEKPFTETPEQAIELAEIAQSKNLILMVDHTFRYTDAGMKLEEMVAKGTVKLEDFHSVRTDSALRNADVYHNMGAHDLYLIDELMAPAEPIKVRATNISYDNRGYNDKITLIVTMSDEKEAIVDIISQPNEEKIRRIVMNTKDGTQIIWDEAADKKLKIYDGENHIATPRITADKKDAIIRMLEDFSDSIQTGYAPKCDYSGAIRNTQLLSAIRQSIELDGASIDVELYPRSIHPAKESPAPQRGI